ncbi:PREDICTED: UPF0587 protein C1orf123-like [Acropora digitifera]|uniref:UPF0587 protein C1orf123-like n=1 Tax=Acropora digitifera TaxID=70779 RepID=UPI000779F859|nr:PREDICTED: UPF0587 protein C1orf123-like [Acropora digitifera]
MVRIALQFKANLENLTNVRPDEDDFRWYLKHVYLFIKFFRLKDWSDYDEKAGQAVGIYEVTHRFVKLH